VSRCAFKPPTPGYNICTRDEGHDGPCAHSFKKTWLQRLCFWLSQPLLTHYSTTDMIIDSLKKSEIIDGAFREGAWTIESWCSHRYLRYYDGGGDSIVELCFSADSNGWDLFKATHSGKDIRPLLSDKRIEKFIERFMSEREQKRLAEIEASLRKALV
jgi:hypothetical protein